MTQVVPLALAPLQYVVPLPLPGPLARVVPLALPHVVPVPAGLSSIRQYPSVAVIAGGVVDARSAAECGWQSVLERMTTEVGPSRHLPLAIPDGRDDGRHQRHQRPSLI